MKSGKISANDLKAAVTVLKKGGVIVYPTETLYGLGADATNPKAIAKVYKIKGRDPNRPLLIMINKFKDLSHFGRANSDAKKLAKKFWPGPISFKIETKINLPANLNLENPRVIGVRYPKNKIANSLVRGLGRPITSTSANISGGADVYSGRQVEKIFKKRRFKPDLIINAGRLRRVKPSTIIDLTTDPYKIVRQGPIKRGQIEKVLNKKVAVK